MSRDSSLVFPPQHNFKLVLQCSYALYCLQHENLDRVPKDGSLWHNVLRFQELQPIGRWYVLHIHKFWLLLHRFLNSDAMSSQSSNYIKQTTSIVSMCFIANGHTNIE